MRKKDQLPPKTIYTVSAGFKCLELLYKKNVDLYLCYCGIEECSPGHDFGPAVREDYLIHFITAGKGIYRAGGETFCLEKGDYFLIRPGEETYYQADRQEPWSYVWVGFNGIKAPVYMEYLSGSAYAASSAANATISAAKITMTSVAASTALKSATSTATSAVTSAAKTVAASTATSSERNVWRTGHSDSVEAVQALVVQMLEAKALTYANELSREGLLYQFLSVLADQEKEEKVNGGQYPGQVYVEHVLRYVEENYDKDIRVGQLAEEMGLNRSYLSSCFKKITGISVKDYLTNLRMEKAEKLLEETDEPVGQIAAETGYEDALAFSKAFKKKYRHSPSDYRKARRENRQGMEKINDFL